MGLAVGSDFEYALLKLDDEQIICAKNRVQYVTQHLKEEEFKFVRAFKGMDFVNVSYEHPFRQYKNHPDVLNNYRAYKTYAKDYVSVEDGTGIVTINGAFGEVDMESAKASGLPILVNVKMDGTYTEEMGEFAGMSVKHANLDQKIAEYLAKQGALLRKENIRHSYPHCWRCDTPLLNYATKAWFIKVTDIKEKLIKNNAKIHWVPEHIREGRFGKWLEGARDWNISRNRFWGCPIPIWECECGKLQCVGSLKELRENSLGGNTFFAVRHGEAEQNKAQVLNSDPSKIFHLTKEGIEQVKRAAQKLAEILRAHGASAQASESGSRGSRSNEAELKNTMIFCSQFPRAVETAEIFSKTLGIPVTVDNRLREHEMGVFEGKDDKSYVRSFADLEERYYKKVQGGESFEEMSERVIEFVNYLNRKFSGKRIVIVTHGDVIRAMARYFDRLSIEETFKFKPGMATVYEYRAGNLPLREGKLDLHKPYIDEVQVSCNSCKKPMKRIPEVLDCWFESGSMPYAQLHYPFENKKEFEENFPAHFIAEGVDQTRGWFYTLHVLASVLFDKPAFNNVIVNGILLAADGEKLSKRKKNYPDPGALFETHGVDSTRLFLYTSTAPLAEDVRFSEKHVEEIVKKFTLTLWNTYSFFVTYANIDGWTPDGLSEKKDNKLDEWIISELHLLTEEMTAAIDEYDLTAATRPLIDFIDNLSNWYVRRSRRRFWKSENDDDKSQAYQTLFTVLKTLALLMAPFMPYTADAIYKNLTGKTSVHLEDWPKSDSKLIKKTLHEEIAVVRTIVSLALKLRSKKNIKVRQPLAKLVLALPKRISQKTVEAYRDVILEELNVKEIQFETEGKMATLTISVNARKIGPKFGAKTQDIIALAKKGDFALQKDGSVHFPANEKPLFKLETGEVNVGYCGKEGFDVESENGILVGLDTKVTKELEQEGFARDIIRSLQELRKKAGYAISDRIYVFIAGPKNIQDAVTRFADFIERETLAIELQEGGDFEWDAEEEMKIDGMKVKLGVRK
ncbi:class I tRNA ligase family protein [Candidatus Peregrinibacteria bacterium]|nr:class I tRNA ligase family protein [Candidatus Peregrinibacteria bacterium]